MFVSSSFFVFLQNGQQEKLEEQENVSEWFCEVF